MTAIEDARAALADWDNEGRILPSHLARALRALLVEHERTVASDECGWCGANCNCPDRSIKAPIAVLGHRYTPDDEGNCWTCGNHREWREHRAETIAPPTDDEREALITDLIRSAVRVPTTYANPVDMDDLRRVLRDAYAAGSRRQGPITDAQVDRVAEAIARTADADYWKTEISEWEGSEDWEREAHPDNYPGVAYEDREWYRKQARAALEAGRDTP
ncbi:hypothetical protein J2Y46_002585 [Microbacterium sp. BE35]|uniref:hypothetical protein n=1 Tax=Microbacterium sp. BE35 TaxID=2817773 RepID=UPI00286281F9|nr:hypothetical protein [Microbacterium sp. BE35]MDR7189759.1 hypothetical protein [Microbacterium sp. BE35]